MFKDILVVVIFSAICFQCFADPCVPHDGVTYRIIGRQSNKALDIRTEDGLFKDGASIIIWSYTSWLPFLGNKENQKWKFTRSDNSYIIASVLNGKVMDVDQRTWFPQGARVQQWTYSGNANQKWLIQPSNDGFCKILSQANEKALDVKDVSVRDGAKVQVWDYVGGMNQQWRLEEVK